MSEHKKTRPTAATVGWVEGGAGLAGASVSTTNNSTATDCRQMRIADLLPTGEQNAVPLRHLRQLVDLPGREIRRQIQMEREQHVPIASGRHGYYIAADAREKDRFVRGMKRRAAEIVKVAEAVEEAVVGD